MPQTYIETTGPAGWNGSFCPVSVFEIVMLTSCWLLLGSGRFEQDHGLGGDSLAAADRAEMVRRGRLDRDAGRVEAQALGQAEADRGPRGSEPRLLRQDSRV